MGVLILTHTWQSNGQGYARWSWQSVAALRHIKDRLNELLKKTVSGRCGHLRGNGGVKGSVRAAQAMMGQYRYVARFDILSYYQSMDHEVLLAQITDTGLHADLIAQIQAYLRLPDKTRKGKGIVASGAISPLLGGGLSDPSRQSDANASTEPADPISALHGRLPDFC
jgi:hypothetical protein